MDDFLGERNINSMFDYINNDIKSTTNFDLNSNTKYYDLINELAKTTHESSSIKSSPYLNTILIKKAKNILIKHIEKTTNFINLQNTGQESPILDTRFGTNEPLFSPRPSTSNQYQNDFETNHQSNFEPKNMVGELNNDIWLKRDITDIDSFDKMVNQSGRTSENIMDRFKEMEESRIESNVVINNNESIRKDVEIAEDRIGDPIKELNKTVIDNDNDFFKNLYEKNITNTFPDFIDKSETNTLDVNKQWWDTQAQLNPTIAEPPVVEGDRDDIEEVYCEAPKQDFTYLKEDLDKITDYVKPLFKMVKTHTNELNLPVEEPPSDEVIEPFAIEKFSGAADPDQQDNILQGEGDGANQTEEE